MAIAQKKKKNKEEKSVWFSSVVSRLKFGNIGPAVTSGRIADFAGKDIPALLASQKDAAECSRIVQGTSSYLGELSGKLESMAIAVKKAPSANELLLSATKKMGQEIADVRLTLSGDGSMSKRSYPTPRSISGRAGSIVYSALETSSAPTETMKQPLKVAEEMFSVIYPRVKKLGQTDIFLHWKKNAIKQALLILLADCQSGSEPTNG